MRRVLVCVLLLAAGAPFALTAQESHPWLVRARGVYIAPDASSKPTALDVKGDATVELDISRQITPILSAELILATASQEVTAPTAVAPTGSLGSVNHLPPTLLLQLHPVSKGLFRPYIGAGGNLTVFYAKSGGLEDLKLSTSVGYAFQAGVDFAVTDRTVVNFDAKYVNIETDVKSGGTKLFHLKVNPFVIGAGLGYRF